MKKIVEMLTAIANNIKDFDFTVLIYDLFSWKRLFWRLWWKFFEQKLKKSERRSHVDFALRLSFADVEGSSGMNNLRNWNGVSYVHLAATKSFSQILQVSIAWKTREQLMIFA